MTINPAASDLTNSNELPASTTDQVFASAILRKRHQLATWLRPASTNGVGKVTVRRYVLDVLVFLCAVVAGLSMSCGIASLRSSSSVDFSTFVFSAVGGGLWAAITYTVLRLASAVRLQSAVGYVSVILLVSILAAATAQMFTFAVVGTALSESNSGANRLIEFIGTVVPVQQGHSLTASIISRGTAVRMFDASASILIILIFLAPVLFSRVVRRTDVHTHLIEPSTN